MLLVSRGIVLLTEFLAVTEDKCQVYHDMCGARFLPFSLLSTPTNFFSSFLQRSSYFLASSLVKEVCPPHHLPEHNAFSLPPCFFLS